MTKITQATFITLITLVLASTGKVKANKVEHTDSLIKKWLSIEQQRSAIINDWHQQKPLLEQRLLLLKQEQTQLEKDLNTASSNDTDVEKKRSELLASQNDMEAIQGQLNSALVDYYQQIAELQPQLPPPLSASWQKSLTDPEFIDADTTHKLSTLLELLEKLNDFKLRISHVESALNLPTESGEKEVMVHQLYLGLSQAWYVSLDGNFVGRGQPSATGWQWLADETVEADVVLNAIAMIERRTEASFLQLPISFSQVANNE